tara:strand:+ start:3547 stop:5271 length:1725 start_codon:yes stop_codon:yes gene_type:complete
LIKKFKTFTEKNLTREEKAKGIIFVILGIIQTILDLLAFSLFIPVITFALNSNILNINNKFLDLLYSFVSDYFDNIPKLFFIILIVFLFKYLFSLFINYYQIKYSNDLISSMRSKLVSKFLDISYVELFGLKSNVVTNGIILSAEKAIEIFYLNSLILISSLFHILIFFIFLTTISLKITVFLSLICSLILMSYFLIISKKINNFGIKKYEYNSIFLQNLQEIFHGLHIVKLFKIEKKLFNLFKIKAFNYGRINTLYKILITFPRISKEIILLTLLIALYYFMKFSGYSNSMIINYITVFCVIGFRLFPHLITVFNMVGNIKHSEFAMEILNKELENYTNKKEGLLKEIEVKESIEFKKICFGYNENQKLIFNNLNFKLSTGEIVGIEGNNGVGKSTFLKILSSLIKPSKGDIYIDNIKLDRPGDYSWKDSVSYIEQNVFLFNDTILKNITLSENNNYDKEELNKIIENTNLKNFINNSKMGLEKEISENNSNISGGEKQKIAISRGLFKKAKFILFDESLSNIDEKSTIIIKDYIRYLKNKNKAIIIISHKKDILSICDKIYHLKDFKFEELT